MDNCIETDGSNDRKRCMFCTVLLVKCNLFFYVVYYIFKHDLNGSGCCAKDI